MKKTFEFTELERSELYDWLLDDADIKHIEQIVSERITPEQDTIKPYHEHGNSVASDRTESGQSAEEIIRPDCYHEDPLSPVLVITKEHALQAMHTYASQVCADKDLEIEVIQTDWKNKVDGWIMGYRYLEKELSAANESLAVMVRKNAELQDQIERFKNPLKAK